MFVLLTLMARCASGMVRIRGHPGERRISYLGVASNDYFFVIPIVCRRMGFEGTDLAMLAHLEYPQSATGILCNPFPFALSQASLDEFSRKSLAERGGFEPPKPFWSLHAFQACLFNHSSISPSSQLACKKKLALRVWLAAVAPLKSNPRGSIYFLFGP